MRIMRTAGYATLFTLVAAVLGYGESTPKHATEFPTSPRHVTPLLIGEMIPEVVVSTPVGETVKLRELAQRAPTLLIFYRGKW